MTRLTTADDDKSKGRSIGESLYSVEYPEFDKRHLCTMFIVWGKTG